MTRTSRSVRTPSGAAAILLLLAACSGLNSGGSRGPQGEDTYRFELALTGMIGFAGTSDGGLEVLLVNQFDEAAFPTGAPLLKHFPQLEVDADCEQFLPESDDAKACPGWDTVPPFDETRAIALNEAYEIRLAVGGARQVGAVERDDSFDEMVIRLGALAQADPSLSGLATLSQDAVSTVPGATAPPVIARVHLNGGTIRAIADQSGYWKFKNAAGGVVLPTAPDSPGMEVGGLATWSIEYAPEEGVRVGLWRPGGTSPARTIELWSLLDGELEPGDLRLVLSNEPDPDEFCVHSKSDPETPSVHFVGFYGLTALGRGKAFDELTGLPMPYPAQAQCEPTIPGDPPKTGRRSECMMVAYDPID